MLLFYKIAQFLLTTTDDIIHGAYDLWGTDKIYTYILILKYNDYDNKRLE